MKKIYKLIISLALPFLASAIGSLFTVTGISSWYSEIQKPFFNPPSWIFGPVWTLLYLLMGISLYLVWTKKSDKKAFVVFGIQLALNALWSILFFGLQNPALAFFEILLLWIAILVTITTFYKIRKSAGYLLIPYLAWVTFASVLNYSIWILNP